MCTSVAFWDRGLYGRNLDLEYHFGEEVVITPRECEFVFHHRQPLLQHYAMIGAACVAQNTPLYAEALNEKGLYMAGLYFPGNAVYFEEPDPAALNLAPYELIPLVLGTCATAAQARSLLAAVRLAAIPFAPSIRWRRCTGRWRGKTGDLSWSPWRMDCIFMTIPWGF